jgi:predicted esterase
MLWCRVVAIASGLLKETLAQLASSNTNSSSSSSQAVPGGAGTPVLITYGTMDDVVDRERVDG